MKEKVIFIRLSLAYKKRISKHFLANLIEKIFDFLFIDFTHRQNIRWAMNGVWKDELG